MNEHTAEIDALARALHQAHFDALDVLHGPDTERDPTPYRLESPSRRAYLKEQARALVGAGWRVIPPGSTDTEEE